MSELPPHLEALLESARREHDPKPVDAERVRIAVMAAVGAGIAGGTAATATATAATAAASAKISGGTAIAGAAVAKTSAGLGIKVLLASALLGSAATVYTISREPAPSSEIQAVPAKLAPRAPKVARALAPEGPAPAAPALAIPAAVPVATPEMPAAAPPEPNELSAPAPSTRARSPKQARHVSVQKEPESEALSVTPAPAPAPVEPAPEPLPLKPTPSNAAELGLIRATLTALRDGQATRALALLKDHEERFPEGMFTTERLGLRVVALCESGAVDQGRKEQAAFLRTHGNAPLAARVRSACEGETP